MNDHLLNISLKQGKEFNKYQTKIKKQITKINKKSSKKEGFVSLEQEQMVRPIYNGYKPVLKNMIQSSNLINAANQQDLDELKQIQLQYDNLILKYTNIQNKIGGSSLNTINRTSNNNPYLNKYLSFNDGTIAFVNNQGYAKPFINEDILNSVVGKNGCPPKDFIYIDMPWTSDYIPGATIPTNPPLIVGTPMTFNQSCGNEGTNVYATKLVNNIKSNYIGCYYDSDTSTTNNDQKAMIEVSNNVGYTTFDNCQEYSINNGYKYFGLQDVQSDGKVLCSISNDLDKTKSYGDASTLFNSIPIWSTNSQGSNSVYSFLSTSGMIILYGSDGTINWSSPNNPPECINGGSFNLTNITATYGANCNDNGFDVPQGNATDDVKSLLSLVSPSDAQLQYPISNSNPYGDPAVGCGKSWDTAYQCGNIWKSAHLDYGEGQNFIYDCKEETSKCVFFLILQSDGNLCIYRGSDPSNKKELIWATQTTGQQKAPNTNWVASKGKFGRNYLKTNEYLASEEWIGSDDGSLKLIMQKDGNLVLYTNENTSGCKVINNKTFGLKGINGVYEINELGNMSTLGKIGYIDNNSELKEYPKDMLSFVNEYQIYPNTWIDGNDLATLSTSDQQGCQSACNETDACAAYAYQTTSKTCWLKDSQSGMKQPIEDVFLGIRKSTVNSGNNCSNKMIDIDTIQYDNYLKDTEMSTSTQCNDSLISQEDQIEFDNIKSQLITLGNDIVSKMENLYNQDKTIFQKLDTTNEQFKKDLASYKLTNMKIKKELNLQSNNIEGMQNLNINDLNGILSDSDIRVLQENYTYIMWSILAVGILIITINSIHK
jgi:hypothetical protein